MIDGKWRLVSGMTDGENILEPDRLKSSLEIVDGRHTVRLGNELLIGTHTLDVNQSPMTIDAFDSAGPFAGQSMLGIFKVEGDEFTVCFAAPGKERPSEFSTQDGKASILHVWQRQEN